MATGPVWTGAENLATTGIRSPDRSARRQSLYRLSYRGPHQVFMTGYYEDNIKIDLIEIGWQGVDWIWTAVVDVVMNVLVSYNWGILRFFADL